MAKRYDRCSIIDVGDGWWCLFANGDEWPTLFSHNVRQFFMDKDKAKKFAEKMIKPKQGDIRFCTLHEAT